MPDGTHPDPNPPARGAEGHDPEFGREAGHITTQDPHDRSDWSAPSGQPGHLAHVSGFPSFWEVHAALASDPEVAHVFQSHWNDHFRPNDLGRMPEDPAGQLCWYGLRDLNEHHSQRHKMDFEDARKHRSKKRVAVVFAKLARIDPLYTGTMHAMDRHVLRLPASGRHAVQTTLERGPDEALDFYREMREVAALAASIFHARRTRRGAHQA